MLQESNYSSAKNLQPFSFGGGGRKNKAMAETEVLQTENICPNIKD